MRDYKDQELLENLAQRTQFIKESKTSKLGNIASISKEFNHSKNLTIKVCHSIFMEDVFGHIRDGCDNTIFPLFSSDQNLESFILLFPLHYFFLNSALSLLGVVYCRL